MFEIQIEDVLEGQHDQTGDDRATDFFVRVFGEGVKDVLKVRYVTAMWFGCVREQVRKLLGRGPVPFPMIHHQGHDDIKAFCLVLFDRKISDSGHVFEKLMFKKRPGIINVSPDFLDQ